ncbi:MAG: glycosyltransferase [ANME-2 cluster archaeon]|nr:glycosyltransferase [ANME-2 cluster archaeon]
MYTFVPAARTDTFPTTIIESISCCTPVIATAVGGIPEQVQDGFTGYLTPPGDVEAMAGRVVELLEDEGLRLRMGEQAADDARKRFDLERQAQEYLDWYEKITREMLLCSGIQKMLIGEGLYKSNLNIVITRSNKDGSAIC